MPHYLTRPPLRRLFAGCALAAGLLPAAAQADIMEASIVNLHTKQIFVESNGSNYHSTSPFAGLVADVHVDIDTGLVGSVKSWSTWLGLVTQDYIYESYELYDVSKSYPWGKRPNSVNKTVQVIVPEIAWGGYVKARCNELADDLRQEGLGNAAIFAEDRIIKLGVVPVIDADTTGAGSGSILVEAMAWNLYPKLDLVCKKWPGARIPQVSQTLTTTPAQIMNNGLSIYELSTLNGACKIRLDGWITTDQKNATVKFRYKNQEGKLSQVWTVNTGESKTATFSHWYNIKNNYDPETGIDWAESGFVRMIGVSHSFQSAWAEYTMECVQGGPGNLATVLPPKVSLNFTEISRVMVDGWICPGRLKLLGTIEGQGQGTAGHGLIVARNYQTWTSGAVAYEVAAGEKHFVTGVYTLDWSQAAAGQPGEPLRLFPRFDFNVTDTSDTIVASVKGFSRAVVCKRPSLNPAIGQGGGKSMTLGGDGAGAPGTPPRALRSEDAVPAAPVRVLPRLKVQPKSEEAPRRARP